ncbi:hypothetical protein NRS6160_11140 [Bacillus subtilis]|nr:hypothetical protein NRS6111_03780 [Bacillus subtilis]CAF1854936.1 hypothetical protein NRS6160_03869 [Bacillus subtilis]CAI6273358.1 hypothetical protein NRS6160_11140 [Bacillus subtilis]
MKVLITPTALMNGKIKLIDPCTKFSLRLINFGLRNYVTERLYSPGFEGRYAEFSVLSLKSVLNLT